MSRERHEIEVIPLFEEELTLEKSTHENRVRVEKSTRTEEVPVNVELWQEQYEIERVERNRPVGEAPKPRYEGDTLILPVLEERLVKQLVLKEEVRLTPRRSKRLVEKRVSLRSEEVEVRRVRGDSRRRENG